VPSKKNCLHRASPTADCYLWLCFPGDQQRWDACASSAKTSIKRAE
jgi:hypothetical protein